MGRTSGRNGKSHTTNAQIVQMDHDTHIDGELARIPHRFLTVGQIARILQMPAWTVRRLVRCGEIAGGFQLSGQKGSSWRVAKSALIEYVQARNWMNVE